MSSLFATLLPLGDVTTPLLLAARRHEMTFHFNLSLQPILALVAGLLILVRPKMLNFVVAGYFILIGLIGIFGVPW